MNELFGAPMSSVTAVLAVIFAAFTIVLATIAVRNRVLVRMAVRNVPRRRAQSILIVIGLMLSTAIISSAFTTGDSITHSIEKNATDSLRSLDQFIDVDDESEVWVGREAPDEFPEAIFDQIAPVLDGDPDIDGVLPGIVENVAVINPRSRQFEVNALLTGLDPVRARAFDALVTTQGDPMNLGNLESNEAYIDVGGAAELGVVEGDVVGVALGPGELTQITVAAIVDGYYFKSREAKVVLLMPLRRAQELLGAEGLISTVLVSHRGDFAASEGLTDGIQDRLADLPAIVDNGLELNPLKSDILDEANEIASIFVSIFTTFGLFSIGVGVLLIFLIFSMLAAERKSEMGISRAVGMQRRHLVRMFMVEGAIYSLGSAAVGALIGVGLGFALVYGVADAFSQGAGAPSDAFTLSPHVSPQSVLASFLIGSIVTFITVSIAARRVSQLNIVRAIRNVPEPQLHRAKVGSLVWGFFLTLIGLLVLITGLQTSEFTFFGLGVSLVPLGGTLILRYWGVSQRLLLSLVGVFLLVFWLLPADVFEAVKDDWNQNFSVFFVSGALVVTGGVLLAMNNSQVLLGLVMRTLGRITSLAPIAKSAVSYPLRATFRTGLSAAMFAAVIFSIIVMATLNVSFDTLFGDQDRLAGGYEVIARSVSDLNPVQNLTNEVSSREDLLFVTRVDGVPAVGTLRTIVDAKGTLGERPDDEPLKTTITGVDDDFVRSNQFGIKLATSEFATEDGVDAAAVWEALRENPGLAVVNATMVPTRNNFNFGAPGDAFILDVEGLYMENDTMDPVSITVTDDKTGVSFDLTIIGAIDDIASFFFLPFGVFTSSAALEKHLPRDVDPTSLFFNVASDAEDAATRIEASLFEFGLDTVSLRDTIDETRSARTSILDLLTGYMALGLVVGIAALGVISARTVVERRHEIGVLRAIGFSRRMVQVSFLMESSFIAFLGIFIGLITGLITAYNVMNDIRGDEPNVSLIIPWGRLALIIAVAYSFSLLTTFLPSKQASEVAPADALRYE
jgi:putative ABC transport system permease protein